MNTYTPFQQPNKNSSISLKGYIIGLPCVKNFVLSLSLLSSLTLYSQDDSLVTFNYPGGALASKGVMINGVPEGKWTTYYEDGTIKSEGAKRAGLSVGEWKFYDEQGRLQHIFQFDNDKRNGCHWKYDTLGNLRLEEHFVDGILDGDQIWYNADGSIVGMAYVQDGKKMGEAIEYGDDGRIITIRTYDDGYLKNEQKLNRYDDQGRKTGLWRTYHQNGSVATEAKYREGELEGVVKEFTPKGKLKEIARYEGGQEVKDPDMEIIGFYYTYHPNGKEKVVGSTTKEGVWNGVFREYDINGNLVGGSLYRQGKKMAEGLILEDGTYQGEWKQFYETGVIQSEGSYDSSLRTGKWKFYDSLGNRIQEGAYKKGVAYGDWTWYYPDGTVRKEEYLRKGKQDGLVVEYDSLGHVLLKGEYLDGERNGKWEYEVGDHIESGKYSFDEKTGLWVSYYKSNGKMRSKGEFKSGKPVGKHRLWFPTGKIKEHGKYRSGKRDKTWSIYREDGTLLHILRYKRGKLISVDGEPVKDR